jgi:hypothetical protein
MIPEMYFDFLKTQDARPMGGIFYHNAVDILSLAGLFSHMAFLLHDPHSKEIAHIEDVVALARFFESTGDIPQAQVLYQKALNSEMPEDLYWDTIERFSFLLKRQDEWDKAIELWEMGAENNALYAIEELAKYYEHRAKTLETAKKWTEKGLQIIREHHLPAYEHYQWQEKLKYRLERLNRRL